MESVSREKTGAHIGIVRDDIPDIIRELLIIAALLPPEMRSELLETAKALASEKAAG